MKKIMALLLSLTLLITTAVNVIWATAADTPVMTVGSVEGCKGDTVEVYVTLENNPGFSAASIEISFDDTNIELTKAELCGNFAVGAQVADKNLPYFTFLKGENTTDSEFLKLTFTIAEDAALGDIPVTVLYEEGYTGDTYCSTCNREISKGQSIAKNVHNPAPVWTTDETDHWKVCQTIGCGSIIDKAPHSGGEANCHAKAVCEICGVEYGDFDSDNHDGGTEVKDAVAATCNKDGYTGDTYCLGCGEKIAEGKTIPATGEHVNAAGKWESDGANHWQVCDSCGTEFNKAAHEGGEATCSAKAVCEVCSAEHGELDPDNHVNTEIRGAVAATEEAEGYTGDKWCLDCDQMIEEGTVIAKLDHTHAMVKTEAKAATCEEDGNIEYYTCSKCGKKYNDEAGTRELRDEETIIEAAGHSYSTEWKSDADSHWHECTCGERSEEGSHTFGDWTVTKEATETADGSRERKCTVCGYVQSEKISAIGGATDNTESDNTDGSGDSDSPQTGDNTNAFLWLVLMAAGGCGLIVTMFARKNHRMNK